MPKFPVGQPRPAPFVSLLALPPTILYDAFLSVIIQLVHEIGWHMMLMIVYNVDDRVSIKLFY
jgi:hypothetical protein